MVSDFLRPDAQSQITDTCNGHACFDGRLHRAVGPAATG